MGKPGSVLNLDNDITFYYIALCNAQRTSRVVKNAVEILKKEIGENTPFYSLVVFGSYSTNEQKPGSGLDVAVFIESEEKKKQMVASINSAKLKIPAEIDAHVIPKAEMIEMLTNNEENLGKQIARKHIAIHNHQLFYEIILEGMRHGF